MTTCCLLFLLLVAPPGETAAPHGPAPRDPFAAPGEAPNAHLGPATHGSLASPPGQSAVEHPPAAVRGIPSEPAAVVHGGPAAPRGWLAALRGSLWICWDDGSRRGSPDPSCWQRVELPAGASDPRELRAQFLDAATVVARGSDDALQIVRGDPAALPIDPAALPVEPRARPAALACGPTGHVPIYSRGRWAWIAAACPPSAGVCVAPPALPPLRRPLALALTLDIEARAGELREVAAGAQAIAGVTVLAALGWSFDPVRQASRRLAWQELQSARRPRLRELPPARAAGPVAAREREVLAAVVCGGSAR